MQRPPADPAVIERGRTLYGVNCSACHGADARGGQLGGPNLLRSQLVLLDQDGEQILPVVQKGRPEKRHAAVPASRERHQGDREFIHSLTGASRGQGAPPVAEGPPPNILVGDASAGQAFFAAKCSSCHSPPAICRASRRECPTPSCCRTSGSPAALRTGRGGGRGGLPPGPAVDGHRHARRREKVEGRLLRIDDFLVSLLQEDGTIRSFRREGDRAEGRAARSARRPSQPARRLHRQGHARRHGLPGHLEMTHQEALFRRSLRSCCCPRCSPAKGKGVDPARAAQAARRVVADALRRLHRAAATARSNRSIAPTSRTSRSPGFRTLVEGPGLPAVRWTRRRTRRRRGTDRDAAHRRRRRDRRFFAGGMTTIKASALVVDGTIYISTPDNAWAIDARDGRELWHYYWKTRGGTHIANRGLGMWNNYLYMETPDNYLVSLDAKTGKERWHKVIADFSLQYFSTTAPIIVGNHVLVGTGNDLDAPGFLQSFDPETGELQWKFYTVPMNQGDPGLDTWPSLDAARHGGAQPWMPGAYDPETHLYIFGTGNPTPAYTAGRGEGRQPLHVLADGRERRHRQDGLVFPDVAARHARLGFGADAGPVRRAHQRQDAQAGLDRGAQRLLLHARSRDRRVDRDEHVRLVDQLGEGPQQSRRPACAIRRRIRPSAARSSRRPPAARSTGSRRRTRPIRACSTSRSTTAIRSSI